MRRFVRLSSFLAWCFGALVCGIALVLASFYVYLAPNLPATQQLLHTQLQTPLTIYTKDKKKIAEFGEKRRKPITYEQVPEVMINAFVAAEDNRFFEHSGIDLKGLARATTQLISTGRIVSGGSTITMQVAKNFFLSRERTFTRKFNEIFLALQIEQNLSKAQILELYLNKIYLGNRAYGVQAAAEVYYGKSIEELNLAEIAMIAGLPKAPSRFNPIVNPERAKTRRNWIIDRMLALGMINTDSHQLALNTPVTARYHGGQSDLEAPYIAEMARQEIIKQFGADTYTSGLRVFLSVDSKRQAAANQAMIEGLEAYDRRHGYRGPLAQLSKEQLANADLVNQALRDSKVPSGQYAAVVLAISEEQIAAQLRNGETITLNFDQARWAAPYIDVDKVGDKPKSWKDIVQQGDIIQVAAKPAAIIDTDTASGTNADNQTQASTDNDEKAETNSNLEPALTWELKQTPEAQGALVSINPQDGAIEALVGGYDFYLNKYNRATQAQRQAGSNFKPFIYLAGLEAGNTAATLINDAPIVFDDKNLEDVWRPENSSGRFYGPTRLRKALYNSRNLVSIRLLKETGIRNTLNIVNKFGFDETRLPRDLSLALGSAALTPFEVATGYAMIANGGYKIEPYLIARIENSQGELLFEAQPMLVCPDCDTRRASIEHEQQKEHEPEIRIAPRIVDERSLYILNSMLKDVITKGTGRKALVLERNDLAGKTGTTNDQKDAWFSGYNSSLQTSVWVGFDSPSTLGRREYGAKAALPIWIDYMRVALEDVPSSNLKRPAGITAARINASTGEIAMPGEQGAIFELFRAERAPKAPAPSVIRNDPQGNSGPTIRPEDIF